MHKRQLKCQTDTSSWRSIKDDVPRAQKRASMEKCDVVDNHDVFGYHVNESTRANDSKGPATLKGSSKSVEFSSKINKRKDDTISDHNYFKDCSLKLSQRDVSKSLPQNDNPQEGRTTLQEKSSKEITREFCNWTIERFGENTDALDESTLKDLFFCDYEHQESHPNQLRVVEMAELPLDIEDD